MDRLRAEGWDVWGYEPHAPVSKEGGDHPFVVRTRGEVSALFDGVFSNNVIEHLFDPADAFSDFAANLRPGGRMAHASPCYAYSFAFTRFHVFFPTGDAPARLGARTALVGAVGDDDLGADAVRELEAEGVDVAAVARLAEHPTGVALIVVDRDGENQIAAASGANAAVDGAAVEQPPPPAPGT